MESLFKTQESKAVAVKTVAKKVAVKTVAKLAVKPASTNGTYFRHGDLLFLKIKEVPKDFLKFKATPKKHPRGVTIVEGDSTAHHHTLSEVAQYYNYQGYKSRISFIVLEREAILDHEEHGIIPLPEGIYQINYQRELDGAQVHNPNRGSHNQTAIEEMTMRVLD